MVTTIAADFHCIVSNTESSHDPREQQRVERHRRPACVAAVSPESLIGRIMATDSRIIRQLCFAAPSADRPTASRHHSFSPGSDVTAARRYNHRSLQILDGRIREIR
jgi:hypothetical protein